MHGATEAPSSTRTRLGTGDTSDALSDALSASAGTVTAAALGGGGEAGGDVAVAVEFE